MRNGMSVKEIYDSLDQLDRLKEAFKKEQEERMRLERVINKAVSEMVSTGMTYTRIAAEAPEHDACTKLEFSSKSSGLLEGVIILRKYTNPGYLKGE